MKTKEELNTLKEEVETVSRKMQELTDEDLEQAAGGHVNSPGRNCQCCKVAILVYGGYDENCGLHYSFCPNPNCKCNNGPYVDEPHRLYYA